MWDISIHPFWCFIFKRDIFRCKGSLVKHSILLYQLLDVAYLQYPLHDTFTRNVWIYKDANYELFNKKISDFDWSCLHQGTVNEASSLFTNIFVEFAKLCIPSKTIVVREDGKPWYDSEIRRNSRKRDRLKKTALKSGNQNDWKKYKYYRNKVNNQKKKKKKKNMLRNIFIII